MPIKPENRARYPRNWKEIRESILARAGNCCERCSVFNHAIVDRVSRYAAFDSELAELGITESTVFSVDLMCELRKRGLVRIVLTIAHLDHQPENNDPANLRALCQKCHNAHDAADRAKNRRIA